MADYSNLSIDELQTVLKSRKEEYESVSPYTRRCTAEEVRRYRELRTEIYEIGTQLRKKQGLLMPELSDEELAERIRDNSKLMFAYRYDEDSTDEDVRTYSGAEEGSEKLMRAARQRGIEGKIGSLASVIEREGAQRKAKREAAGRVASAILGGQALFEGEEDAYANDAHFTELVDSCLRVLKSKMPYSR